ncbi:MAG: hypothetical protein E6Q97_06105 [Desulfurellales bacterium]|nr:MAG: hypothetical protein E6Q97_06105 [Desulfurellales bacterium]
MTPYSAELPLRTTSVWAGFRETAVIPHRYGETGGRCLQYNSERTRFVWADHACASIDDVLVGGQSASNWQARNVPDNTGNTVAVIEFDAGIDDGVDVVARGRGKLLGDTGVLIESPADVVRDMLILAGRPTTAARLDPFRSACARAGIVVGGSIATRITLQSAIREVCDSVGAIFAPDARDLCHLWPGPASGLRESIDVRQSLSASLGLDDLATAAVITYAHEDGEPRAAVELEAREPSSLYGRRVTDVAMPWVRSARVAVAVGTRLLQHMARPAWSVGVGGLLGDIRVGDGIALDHPVLPVTGDYTVLGRETEPETQAVSVTLSVPVGAVPVVRLIRQSSMLDPEQYSSAGLQLVGAEYVLTLREESGQPIAFASVTLDGQMTRTTDAAGRVAFPSSAMAPGEHRFDILTQDSRSLSMTVTV